MTRTVKGPAKQRGMTAIGWLLTGTVAAVVVLGAVKLMPVFMEHQTVKGILEQIASGGGAKSPADIRERLTKLLDVNSIKTIKTDQIEIDRVGPNFKLTITYENRVKYMGPVDFLVHYTDVQEIPAR